MVVNVTCPTCGHKSRLTPGQETRCPSCLNLIPSHAPPPSSLLSRPNAPDPAEAPNRTVLAQPEAMIRYTCPRCKKSLESPVSFAGQKLNCPDCNQRLQIPQPSTPPAPPVNKTVLATEEPSAPAAFAPSSSRRTAPPPPVPVVEEAPSPAAAARQSSRETCLECGADVTERPRIQTCADCGSLLCSAACYREHRHHAHAPRRKSPRRDIECTRCGSTERPYATTHITEAGWITFAILLVLFFPLCWIGLLITETRWKCADCGARLT
jgi:DNA-directed RNA polymerase subunit RPC12/RpoP